MNLHPSQYRQISKKKIFEKKSFFSVVGKNSYMGAEISTCQKNLENVKLRSKHHPRS